MKTKLFLFLIALLAPALTISAQTIQQNTAPLPNAPTNTVTAPESSNPLPAPGPSVGPGEAATNTASASANTAAASTNTIAPPEHLASPVMPYPMASSTNPPAVTNKASGDEVLETITFEDDPLPDAIRTLALMAGLNIQFDHRLDPMTDPNTHLPIAPPTVKEKWHNLTAFQAMQAVLAKYDWQMKRTPTLR